MSGAISSQGARGLTWRRLVGIAAATEVVVLLGIAALLGDRESAAFAALVAAGSLLLRFRRRAGTILVGLISANVAFFTATATAANLLDRAPLGTVAVPAAVAAVSLVTTISSLAALTVGRRPEAVRGTAMSVAIIVVAFVATLGAAAALAAEGPSVSATALRVEAKNTAFSARTLTASAGVAVVRFANRDLFWHTFTVDELGVDLKVPVGGERTISFNAPPGTYPYYCGVPGHREAGMQGTLTVR